MIKVLYMRCLILKLQGPNLKSADRIAQKDILTTMTDCDQHTSSLGSIVRLGGCMKLEESSAL